MNKVSINDLRPSESTFVLSGKTYTLKAFTLAAQVWANDEFSTPEQPNGLFNLSDKLQNLDPDAVAKSCYYLLKDKSDFPTLDKFLDALGDHYTILKVLLQPFSNCLGVSQPTEDETAEEIELKK